LGEDDLGDASFDSAIWNTIRRRLKIYADEADTPVWISSANGDCIYVNEAWCVRTAQTQQDAAGVGWTNALHPDDRISAFHAYLKACEAIAPYTVRYRLKNSSGFDWVVVSGTPYFDEQGKLLGYCGIDMPLEVVRIAAPEKLAGLTPREREVLELIIGGSSNKEAGRKLDISPRTVEVHRSRLMEKLGVRNVAELVRVIISDGTGTSSGTNSRSLGS
jgi:PAS domain S-box-containing protein